MEYDQNQHSNQVYLITVPCKISFSLNKIHLDFVMRRATINSIIF